MSISIVKSEATRQKAHFSYFLLQNRHFALGDRILDDRINVSHTENGYKKWSKIRLGRGRNRKYNISVTSGSMS